MRVLSIRRPEHTGENRCWPCTAVNVVIVAALAVVAAVVSPILAVGTAVAGLFLVGVRGYLIPGTPRFAPAVVARLPGGEALFHDAGSRESGSLGGDRSDDPTAADDGDANTDGDEPADPPAGDELLDRLVDAGVLDADGERVAPTAEFEERWHAEMAALRGADTDALADAALEFSPATESHAVRQDGDEWVALSSGAEHAFEETWLSRPVAVAEIGGARAAADFVDDDTALAAAQTCRLFLSACPDCGTALERGTEVDCCGGYRGTNEVPAETLVCPSCEVRVYTFE
ncbi:hypothetical protein [Halobellus ruber]|uniref:Uncharacterized protein n=1 Tax=Halobellus ruber TaxID=2761102 RepID=A0A7J9SJ63_9EURY|nr:hypothetical protein [Halobellus ruber]MBB6646965.1 hypothetical protein [Halobellus ruber]